MTNGPNSKHPENWLEALMLYLAPPIFRGTAGPTHTKQIFGVRIAYERDKVPPGRQEQAHERHPLTSFFLRGETDRLQADHCNNVFLPLPATPRVDPAARRRSSGERGFFIGKRDNAQGARKLLSGIRLGQLKQRAIAEPLSFAPGDLRSVS
jgi:hypothetical protein